VRVAGGRGRRRRAHAAVGRSTGYLNLGGTRSYFKAAGNPFVPELMRVLAEGYETTVEFLKTDLYKAIQERERDRAREPPYVGARRRPALKLLLTLSSPLPRISRKKAK
jgi:hypothetical protein